MAIDTAAKRKSCLGLALLFLRPGVIPDASDLSAAQRLHTDGLYAGIAADAPTVSIVHTISVDGTYLPTLTLDGTYLPTVAIDGHAED